MSARVLVVGCGFPQLGLIRYAKSLGLTVLGADQRAEAPGVAFADGFVPVSTVDVGGLVEAARQERVDGIVTCGSEAALIPVARATRELGLPFYATPEVLAGFGLKHDMRDRYRAGGAPSPGYAVARSVAEVRAFARSHALPLVVKPTRGWGQRGVRIVHTADELEIAAREALEVAATASGGEAAAVVEEFVEGREFSVDAVTVDGETQVLAITERIITGYPDPPGITFAEVHPPHVPDEEAARITNAAIRGAAALGVTRGPTYTQVRSGPRGAFLIETAHRLGGGLDPDVAFLASGVSLYKKLLGVALGNREWERAGVEGPRHGGAVGRFIIAVPGRVVAVEGLDAARALPGIDAAHVFVGVGDTVHPLTDGSKRAGCVLAHGRDREEAEANAARAMSTIRIVTKS